MHGASRRGHGGHLLNPRLVIVGAGPAGMSAALAAASAGVVPVVLDAQAASGGQIWRGGPTTDLHVAFNRRAAEGAIDVRFDSAVIDAVPGHLVTTQGRVPWDRLILATGARELFLPFPGWTEARVMGAGGLQAAFKAGLKVKGKKILLAGSGPLLLAVAAALMDAGAEVVAVCEQAPRRDVVKFGLQTALLYGKLGQAIGIARKTSKVFRPGTWIEELVNQDEVGVRLNGRRDWIWVDYVSVGFGLVPNLELPRLLGCKTVDGRVQVDSSLQTSQPHIYSAGEASGIGGVDAALAEGRLAARSALGLSAEPERAQVLKWRRFEAAMEHAYALRPELKALARPETLVCRCEHVSYGDLQSARDPLEAKLDHRVGMGWCQGRVCGAACRELFDWPEPSVRPPLFPIPAAQYANLLGDHDES